MTDRRTGTLTFRRRRKALTVALVACDVKSSYNLHVLGSFSPSLGSERSKSTQRFWSRHGCLISHPAIRSVQVRKGSATRRDVGEMEQHE